MSTRSELKENILASKLEIVIKWGMENRGPVLTIAGLTLAGLLLSSVFILRSREQKEFNVTRLAQVQALVIQKRYDQARSILEDMALINLSGPLAFQIPYYRGVTALGLKDYAAAQTYLKEAFDKGGDSPLKPLTLVNLGFAFEEAGDPAGAVEQYGRFMADFPEHFMAPRVQLLLGKALLRAGKEVEGKKALEQLVDLYPTSAWAENARSIMDKYKTR